MSKIKNKIYFISLIFLSYLALINCLIELPLTYKNIKGLAKKNIIKAKKSDSETSKFYRLGETISYEEGDITVNNNYYFLTTVKIGSNDEKYNLILETGSSDLWVVQRRVGGFNSPIRVNRYYNPTSSSSSNNTGETFTLNYGSAGSVTGTYYIDQFKYIGNKNFNMKFGVANRISITGDGYGNADGVLGLGHYYQNDQLSFMHMLKQYDVTDSKIFSIKLDSDIDMEEGATGKLYIGKHEDFSSKNSVTCPLIKVSNETEIFWNFQINGIGFKQSNKEIKSTKTFNVILETATNYLLLPYEYLNDIVNDLAEMNCEPYQEYRGSYYEIMCPGEIDILPDFQLNINGTILTIPAKYAFGLSMVNYYSNIYFTTSEELYIIGSPFLFAYHTLFDGDNEKLHFYPNFEEKDDKKENENEKEKENEKENENEKEKENDKENEKENEKENDKENEKENDKENEKENDKENENENEKNKDKDKDNAKNKTKTNDTESGTNKDDPEKKKKKGKSNLWIIIPCIIGGVILLIGLGILIYYCIKSKNAKKGEEENNGDTTEPIVENNENNENNEDNEDN